MKRAYFQHKNCALRFYKMASRLSRDARFQYCNGYYTVYWWK